LILGLRNPVVSNRMFVIETVGKRKLKKAVPSLLKMLEREPDTYEAVEILKALLNIGTEEAISGIERFSKNTKNKVAKSFAQELLKELSDKGSLDS